MKKILLGLLVCAGFCACSNDDVVLTDSAVLNEGGDSYISFAINLPTQATTRANDVYDDGLAAEYNVNDATLYLFQGTSEAAATLYASYTLSGNWGTYSPADDNITSRQSFTQQITRPTAGNNLYALVVLNGAGMTNNFTTGTTLADLQSTVASMDVATIASISSTGVGNFYMTNAPLWKGTRGGYVAPTGEVTTLAYIDSSKIYDTAEEAEDNTATEIYVERGVAKVTIDGTSATSSVTGNDGSTLSVSVDGFVLDLTNLSGYPVRNTQTTDEWWAYANSSVTTQPYRMVGNTEIAADLYRTYWATDVNYDDNMYTGGESGNRTYPTSVNSLDGTAPTGSELTLADGVTGAYCLENTFTVAHQNQDETTRAIVAVTIGTDGDFYTFEGDKSTLYTATDMANEVISLFAANGDVEAAVKESWQGLESEGNDIYSYYAAVLGEDGQTGSRDITVDIEMADGKTFDTGDFKDGEIPAILTPGTEAFQTVIDQINADHEFSYYAGGVAYYPVLIKHFGDDLTPWDTGDAVDGDSYPTVGQVTGDNNWLGRYGVLRNNWYDVTVTAVTKLGSADVPTAYGEPDDPTESWISVEINILSWAKRTQDVTL